MRRVDDLSESLVQLDALLAHDGWPPLPEIKAPALLIGGERDVFHPPAMLRSMHERLPNSELLIYPGVGHGLLELQKKAFERDVLRFLGA